MCYKIDSSATILLYLFGLLCVTSYPISLSSLLSGEGCILDSNRILALGRKCNFDGTLHFSGQGISSLQTVEISGNDDQSSTISLEPTETVLLAPSSTLTLRKVCIQRAIFNSTANLLSFRGIDIPNTSHAVVKIQDSTLLLLDCDDWAELHKMICSGKVQGSLQVNETFIKATWASSSNMHWHNVRLPLPPHCKRKSLITIHRSVHTLPTFGQSCVAVTIPDTPGNMNSSDRSPADSPGQLLRNHMAKAAKQDPDELPVPTIISLLPGVVCKLPTSAAGQADKEVIMSRITIAGSEVSTTSSTMMSVLDMSLMDFQLVGPLSFLTLQNLVLVNKPTVPSLYNPLGLLTMLSNVVSCLGHANMSTSCKSLSLRSSTSVQEASGSGTLISLNNVTIVLPAQELKVIRCFLINSSMADSMTQPVVRRLMETYLKASQQAMIVGAEQQDMNVCSSLLLLPNKQMTHGRHQPLPLRAAIPPGDVIFPTLMWPGVTGRQVTLTSSYSPDSTSVKELLSTNNIMRAGHSTLAPNADKNVQRPSLRDMQISVPHTLQAAAVPSAHTVRLVSLLPDSQSTTGPSSRYYDPPSISPALLPPSSRHQTTAIVSWLLMVTGNNHSFSEQSNIPRTASAGGRRFIMLISAHFPYAIYVLKICSVVVGLVLGLCLLYFVKRRMMEEGYTGPETLGELVRYLLRKFSLYSLKSWWIFCCCCHDGSRTTSHLESNDVIRSAPSDVEVGLQVPHAPPAKAAVPPEDERVDLLPSSSSPCLEDNEKCRSLLEDQESPLKDGNANYLPKSKTMLQSFCEGIVVSDTEEHGSMQNALVNHNSIILLRRSVKKVLESQMEDLREELQLQNHRSVECVGSLDGGHRDYRDYPDNRLGSSSGSGACNEWELAGLLGKGGFGCVYKGTWRGLPVAVKRIVFQVLADKQGDDQRQQTLREAAINEMVHHPCLVNTYTTDIHCLTDVNTAPIQGVMDWQMHIIMEYCDGGSLRDALDQDLLLYDLNVYIGSNSSQAFRTQLLLKMLQILKQVASGCAYLHSQNIFHGDLKPDNVLLKSIGTSADAAAAESQGVHVLGYQVKVADFGLSKNLHDMESPVFSCSKLGTPIYTAPEILNDGRASKGADVYSFGVMMWELLWYTLWACQQRPSGPPDEDHTSRSAAGLSPGNWIWPKDDDTASGHQVGPSAEQLKDIPTYPFQLHRELSTVDVRRIRSDLEVTFDTASVPLSYRLIGLACTNEDVSFRPSFDHLVQGLEDIRIDLEQTLYTANHLPLHCNDAWVLEPDPDEDL